MEVVVQTEYQDIYGIADGVLLVVNKFRYIKYAMDTYPYVYPDGKRKSYDKYCQKCLSILKDDYYDKYHDLIISKGTVLYMNCPVQSITNKDEWEYEIKTTGSAFSGNAYVVENMLNEILRIVRE